MLTLQHGKPVLILSNVCSHRIGLVLIKCGRCDISCNVTAKRVKSERTVERWLTVIGFRTLKTLRLYTIHFNHIQTDNNASISVRRDAQHTVHLLVSRPHFTTRVSVLICINFTLINLISFSLTNPK